MKNKNVKDEKKEKKIGLTTKIFIALLLGADSRQQGKK